MKNALLVVGLCFLGFAGFGQNWQPLVVGRVYTLSPDSDQVYRAVMLGGQVRFESKYNTGSTGFGPSINCNQPSGILSGYAMVMDTNQVISARQLSGNKYAVQINQYNFTVPCNPGTYGAGNMRYSVASSANTNDSLLTYTDFQNNSIGTFSKVRGWLGAKAALNLQPARNFSFRNLFNPGDTLGYSSSNYYSPFGGTGTLTINIDSRLVINTVADSVNGLNTFVILRGSEKGATQYFYGARRVEVSDWIPFRFVAGLNALPNQTTMTGAGLRFTMVGTTTLPTTSWNHQGAVIQSGFLGHDSLSIYTHYGFCHDSTLLAPIPDVPSTIFSLKKGLGITKGTSTSYFGTSVTRTDYNLDCYKLGNRRKPCPPLPLPTSMRKSLRYEPLTIAPNPAQGKVLVKTPQETLTGAFVEAVATDGRRLPLDLLKVDSGVDVSVLPPGLYQIEVRGRGVVYRARLIRE